MLTAPFESSRWSTVSLGRVAKVVLGKMIEHTSGEDRQTVPYVKAKNVRPHGVDVASLGTMSATSSDIRHLDTGAGDLFVIEGGATAGRVAQLTVMPPKRTIFQNSVHRIRALQSMDQRYLYYVLVSLANSGWYDAICSTATFKHLTWEKMIELPIPVPGLEEQRRIADMLDHETARVDTLIAKNAELRKLIEERRTRRAADLLELDAPVRPLRYCLRQFIGGDWGSDAGDEAVDINVYRAADFDRHRHLLDPSRAPTRSISTTSLRSRELEVGDIIIEKSGGGEKQPVGCCVIVRSVAEGRPRIPSNFNARIVVSSDLEPEFLNAVLAGLYRSGRTVPYIKQTTGIQNLDLNAFLDVKVPVPDKVCQARLARMVIDDWSELDELDSRILHQQSLLRERREALITAAVTGETDV